ncbi:MAG: GvpL/GvpF family gas vesicle protein [Nocardiopsaceae bacterium]|nr:GvpL/GvpF family gas vesicle protein [Nocardiopsaceae bacterium]
MSNHASGASDNRAYYIYGIVPADVEPAPDASGVGDPPAKIELIRHDKIAALVSEIDVSKPLGRPEDLMAHQRLLDAAVAEIPVLPLRFGAVMTGPEAVTGELLAPAHDEFAAALSELEGRAEYVVRGRYEQDAILREVLSEDRDAASLREQIRAVGDEDATREQRIQLGELINEAVSVKREADTRALGDALAPHCVASKVREPTHEEDAANIAVLAESGKQAGLEQAIGDLARDWEGRVELRVLGPMAPYDFVVTAAPEA